MREVGSLEPKPGLPPSTAHLTELLAQLTRQPAKAIVRSAYNDPRPAEWLAERAERSRGDAAVHRRRHRAGEGPVRAVRRHARAAAGGGAIERARPRLGILWPALRRRPARHRDARAARHAGARAAASCSSISRSRRSPGSAWSSPTGSASSRRAGRCRRPRWARRSPARCCSRGPRSAGPRCRKR